jgi:hypothetical protein
MLLLSFSDFEFPDDNGAGDSRRPAPARRFETPGGLDGEKLREKPTKSVFI